MLLYCDCSMESEEGSDFIDEDGNEDEGGIRYADDSEGGGSDEELDDFEAYGGWEVACLAGRLGGLSLGCLGLNKQQER